jgi:energy-coupling factor transporter ATP-binding protein EcfA2
MASTPASPNAAELLVAGRDVIKVSFAQTVLTAEQAYQVSGLPNPYLGLGPFTYAGRERFAGRERLVKAALAQLTTSGEERALLFVTGASGSGKSSFVQAGLLPALEEHYTARARTLRHAVMRPSKQPLAALAHALRQIRRSPKGAFTAATPFALGGLIGKQPDVAVLVIDVLCTLWSDFLGELAERHALEPVFREQVLLRSMDADELREAIQRPIQENPSGEAD